MGKKENKQKLPRRLNHREIVEDQLLQFKFNIRSIAVKWALETAFGNPVVEVLKDNVVFATARLKFDPMFKRSGFRWDDYEIR